ncbi:hypothetical protein C1H46_006927 [Malus baccata]|uniref:Ubiquitin-like protease family profile domain-containing protein n=1 Tax=Malus baccata TaxID=106549 RepID=A0A540NAE4_MALBA|nr:hypothetical protein C1H46_006927 [Malus baccata]
MTHYNSARQNSKDEDLECDCYKENAAIMGNFVQYWLEKARESTSHSKLRDLNQETMKKINSIKSHFEFQVKEDIICAQQKPTTLDCGLYMVSFIDQLSKNQKIQEHIQDYQVLKAQKDILVDLMNHEYSWTKEQEAFVAISHKLTSIGH